MVGRKTWLKVLQGEDALEWDDFIDPVLNESQVFDEPWRLSESNKRLLSDSAYRNRITRENMNDNRLGGYGDRRYRSSRLSDIEDRTSRALEQYGSVADEAASMGIDANVGKDDPGLLSTILGGLDRVASTGAGFATGLLGMDLQETDDHEDRDAGFFDVGEAFKRAAMGASGTHIGFGDTEALAYDADDNWAERAMKVVGSAAGDIVTDPLSYITAGAGVAGRKLATEGVEAASRKLAQEAIERGGDELATKLVRNIDEGTVAEALEGVTRHSGDEILAMGDDELTELLRRENLLNSFAEEGFVNRSAAQYAQGGAQGLRTGFIDDLGEEAGEEFFARMPAEARGGLRLQVPFTRLATEAGFGGGGRIAEKIGAGGVLRATHSLRRAAQRSGANEGFQKVLGGRFGAAWAQTLKEVHARDEDVVGAGWSAYRSLREADASFQGWSREFAEQNKLAATELNRFLTRTPGAKPEQVRKAMGWFLMDRSRLADDALLDPELGSLGDEALTAGREAAEYAFDHVIDRVGGEARNLFGGDAMGWVNEYVPRMLAEEEQALRKAGRVGKGEARGGSKPGSSRTGVYAKWEYDEQTGRMWVADWFRPDEANELSGRKVFETDPVRIAAEYADKMGRAIGNERLRRTLEDAGVLARTAPTVGEQFTSTSAKAAVKPGLDVARQKQQALDRALDTYRTTGKTKQLRRVLRDQFGEEVGEQPVTYANRASGEADLSDGTRLVNGGSKQRPSWRIQLPDDVAPPKGGWPVRRFKSVDELRKALPEPSVEFTPVTAKRFSEAISDARRQTTTDAAGRERLVGETVYQYLPSEYSKMKVFLSPDGKTGFALKDNEGVLDLVSVFNVGGRGAGQQAVIKGIKEGATTLDAFDESGYLPDLYARFGFRETGRDAWDPQYAPPGWGGDEPAVVYMKLSPMASTDVVGFGSREQAKAFAEKVTSPARRAAADADALVRAHKRLGEIGADMDAMEQALDVRNLPLDDEVALDQYLDDLSRVVGKWASANPDKVKASFWSKTRDRKAQYTKALEEAGWVQAADDTMKEPLARRLRELGAYGPEMVVEHMARHHRAIRGEATLEAFVDGWWKPYYTLFKAFATVGRGPGFVARNVMGGTYNAWLHDVQAKHFAQSAKAMMAVRKARLAAEEAAGAGASEAQIAQLVDGQHLEQSFRSAFGERGPMMARRYRAFLDQGLSGDRGRVLDAFETGSPSGKTTIFDPRAPKVDPDLQGLAGHRELFVDDGTGLTWAQRGANKVTTNRASGGWLRFMGRQAENSETYLRLATFMKGADDFGIDDGGLAAGLGVKATQFDYSDLSPAEQRWLKNIVPFYTWTRRNLPLQARSLMTEPGKVTRLLHVNDALKEQYGSEEEYPLPDWVEERFGWSTRATAGGVVGEDGAPIVAMVESPATDLNRWLEAPKGRNPIEMLGLGEARSSMNPALKLAAELGFNVNSFTGAELDQSAPGEIDSRVGHAARSLIPPVGQAQRLLPWLTGSEKYADRWGTSVGSQVAAVPAMTLTEGQQAGELYGRIGRLEDELRDLPWEQRQEARDLMRRGYGPDEVSRILAGQ